MKDQIADGYLYLLNATKRTALEKARLLLSKVGITDTSRVLESYPGELSGGMRQRVNIAMALMCDPKVIIADEPTTALDSVVQSQVLELFRDISEERHVALVMISHDLNLIRRYSSRMVIMYAGRVVEEGPSEALFDDPLHPYTRALLSVMLGPHRDPSVRLQEIPGNVPETGRDTGGCLFRDRCPERGEDCLARLSTRRPRAARALCPCEGGCMMHILEGREIVKRFPAKARGGLEPEAGFLKRTGRFGARIPPQWMQGAGRPVRHTRVRRFGRILWLQLSWRECGAERHLLPRWTASAWPLQRAKPSEWWARAAAASPPWQRCWVTSNGRRRERFYIKAGTSAHWIRPATGSSAATCSSSSKAPRSL